MHSGFVYFVTFPYMSSSPYIRGKLILQIDLEPLPELSLPFLTSGYKRMKIHSNRGIENHVG